MTTLKWTIVDGNWRQVPVVLVRQGNGWVEAAADEAAVAGATAADRRAA